MYTDEECMVCLNSYFTVTDELVEELEAVVVAAQAARLIHVFFIHFNLRWIFVGKD